MDHPRHPGLGLRLKSLWETITDEDRLNKIVAWLIIGLAMGISYGSMLYVPYVGIGRVCVPAVRGHEDKITGFATGVGLLAAWSVPFIIMVWAGIKAILTPPGFADEHVVRLQEGETGEQRDSEDAESSADDYDPAPPILTTSQAKASRYTADVDGRKVDVRDNKGSTKGLSVAVNDGSDDNREAIGSANENQGTDVPKGDGGDRVRTSKKRYYDDLDDMDLRSLARRPSRARVLAFQHRYCRHCKIIRPARTHHCDKCDRCVLKFYWHRDSSPLGPRCIGMHNQRYYFIVWLWTSFFYFSIMVALLVLVTRDSIGTKKSVDPHFIVAIPLGGIHSFLHFPKYGIALTLANMTYKEFEAVGSTRDRERELLNRDFKWTQFREKRAKRAEWDAEWGRIEKEGHLWYLGSKRKHWELVFGENPWTWLLPIGSSPGDGLTWERNPRCDRYGRWRPRREWPASLRDQ